MSKKPEKMNLESMNITEDQKRKLKELFPEVFNEQKIDWEKLQRTLGKDIDSGQERYGMTWPGKSDCFKIIQEPSIGTLKPCKEESVDFDNTQNLFIEGDNLEALKLLQKSYYNKVKMIYIDPPYNTGKDFIYPDDYSESLDTYLKYTGQKDEEGLKFSTNQETDGRFHSKWLNMMYPRLFLARNLLRDDGVIFISIGENELSNTFQVLKEIFGKDNSLSIIARSQKGGGNKGNYFNPVIDYIVSFAKDKVKLPSFTDYINPTIYNKIEKEGPRKGDSYAEVIIYMPNLDYRPNQRFWIKAPDGKKIAPPEMKSFRWTEERFKRELANGNVIFKKTKNSKLVNEDNSKADWIIYQKRFYKDSLNDEKARPNNLFLDFQNMRGSSELSDLNIPFDYPKPSKLIKHLMLISKTKSSDLVLDFFSGSCTSAHATINSNKEDGGNRKYIMVQLPELCDEISEAYKEGCKTVADLGKKRIRRVIKKIKSENNEEDIKGLDLGFKVFKLDKSNFKVWDNVATGKTEEQLEIHLNEIIDANSSEEDILYEILLKSGFEITTKIEIKKLADKKVYSIQNDALLICLDKKLSKEVILEMAKLKPARVVCLDIGFYDNDQLKTNAVETMRSHGVTDFKTV